MGHTLDSLRALRHIYNRTTIRNLSEISPHMNTGFKVIEFRVSRVDDKEGQDKREGETKINQSIKTHFYSAICRERIKGA